MDGQELVTLATCAAKSSQEAKKAEAHARASRVYAKKAEKDAKEAQVVAVHLIQFAKDILLRLLYYSDDITDVSLEDLDALVKIANIGEPLLDAVTLQSLLNCETINIENSGGKSKLHLSDEQMARIEKEFRKTKISDSSSDSDSENADLLNGSTSSKMLPNLDVYLPGSILGVMPSSLLAIQQSTVATKRKHKRRKKTRAMGIPSPLLSQEEVTIVKRATSPSPSQHSGLSPYVGTQHKYSIRKRRSNSSLQTITDDEERPTSPLACAPIAEKKSDANTRTTP